MMMMRPWYRIKGFEVGWEQVAILIFILFFFLNTGMGYFVPLSMNLIACHFWKHISFMKGDTHSYLVGTFHVILLVLIIMHSHHHPHKTQTWLEHHPTVETSSCCQGQEYNMTIDAFDISSWGLNSQLPNI